MAYSTQPKMWFWIVTILFLLWNLMGVGAWSAEAMASSDAFMDGYTQEQIDFYKSYPSWYTWAYGVAVSAGLFACISLVFKKKQAVLLALLSFIAVIICRVYEITVDAWSMMMTADKVLMIMVAIFSVLLWLFARSVRQKGWLN
jgi:hypothetical protein